MTLPTKIMIFTSNFLSENIVATREEDRNFDRVTE